MAVTARSNTDRGLGQACAQVVVTAHDPTTGEERRFATPCAVPEGWNRGPAPGFSEDRESGLTPGIDFSKLEYADIQVAVREATGMEPWQVGLGAGALGLAGYGLYELST